MYCPKCGKPVDESYAFCPECGAKLTVDAAAAPTPTSDPAPTPSEKPEAASPSVPPRKKSRGWLVALIAAGAAVLVLAGGFGIAASTGVFVPIFGSPLQKITAAAGKNISEGSFHVEVTRSYNNEQYSQSSEELFTGDFIFNLKREQLGFYVESGNDRSALRDGMLMNGYLYPVYDEYWNPIVDENGNLVLETHGSIQDISDQLDEFFDAYKDQTEKDSDAIFKSNGDINFNSLEELLSELYRTPIDLSDYIEEDESNAALKQLKKDLNDTDWLEEYLGYEKTTEQSVTYHSFTPDLEKLLKYVKDTVKPCLSVEYRSDFVEAINALLEDVENQHVTVRFGIKRGYLVEFNMIVREDASEWVEFDRESTFTVTFSDIGTANLDDDAIDQLYADIRKYENSRNY